MSSSLLDFVFFWFFSPEKFKFGSMFPHQFATKQDLKELARIERRRFMEEARKRRIFNPRVRLIGVDVRALDQQVSEKNAMKSGESELQRRHDMQLDRRNADLDAKLGALAAERSKLQSEINEFRSKFQRPEQTRDFDLNDPDRLRKSLPTRVGDHDPRLGISSAQVFMGEDLQGQERRREQRMQQKAWLQQQIDEKKRTQAHAEETQRRYEAFLRNWSTRMEEIDEDERKLRRQIQQNISRFNLNLASERERRRQQLKVEEDQDNLAEMVNILTSDMMTENKDLGKESPLGGKRLVVSQYRGMSDAEIQEIRDEQLRQIAERRQRKEDDKIEKQKFDDVLLSQLSEANNQEERMRRGHEAMFAELKLENDQLREQQMQNLRDCRVDNMPTEEYFAQFNTTTR